jgi:hypothetical protein
MCHRPTGELEKIGQLPVCRPTDRNVWSASFLQAKNEDDRLVCANVSGLFVSHGSWHSMECAALASYLLGQSLRTYSGRQVWRAPGSTVLPSHCSPANLAGKPNSVSSSRRWSAIVGIADAISKPGVFCQASIAGQSFRAGHLGGQQRRPICFSFCQHCPCHAGHLVG